MIEVISHGIGASFQDLGRFGYRKLGVPLAGAMDLISAVLSNQILGNSPELTVIEFAFKGPILKFHESAEICISGADYKPKVNGQNVIMHHSLSLSKGDILSFGNAQEGIYGYLAIRGGFKAESILESTSHFESITVNNKIEKGKFILFNNLEEPLLLTTASVKPKRDFIKNKLIPTYLGPDFQQLQSTIQKALCQTKMTVSNEISRMGYRLNHDADWNAKEIITAPVQPGTVQLTPSGKLIVLMRDAQTTGGYARVLQLTEKGISMLSQKRPATTFRFELISH